MRALRGDRFERRAGLSERDRPQGDQGEGGQLAAVGYYVGNFDKCFFFFLDISFLERWSLTFAPSPFYIQYFIQYAASTVGGGASDPNQPESAFRIPWAVQMVPAIVLLVGLFFFPYSPRWLASKDRWEEALQVLASLHGNGDVNHPKVLATYQEIEEALRFEREQAVSSFKALVEPRMLKRVALGMSIQMWSQLCGMNIMM